MDGACLQTEGVGGSEKERRGKREEARRGLEKNCNQINAKEARTQTKETAIVWDTERRGGGDKENPNPNPSHSKQAERGKLRMYIASYLLSPGEG